MLFGMINSPAICQRLINSIIAGLEHCEAYTDDAIIYNDKWNHHLETIKAFFGRLSEAKPMINLAKSEFCHANLTFLGHVGKGQVKPVGAKVEAISDFPVPTCKRQLMRFLGMADYYRKLCNKESVLLAPNFNKEFKVAIDASDVGAGDVLSQEDNNCVDHPVCYFSKKFDKYQKNYSTVEKECLCLIPSLQHFLLPHLLLFSVITIH